MTWNRYDAELVTKIAVLITDRIDINPHESGHWYSEQTYSEDSPATIMVYPP